jgi:hypothetical protein
MLIAQVSPAAHAAATGRGVSEFKLANGLVPSSCPTTARPW